jgi:hypothetical protein
MLVVSAMSISLIMRFQSGSDHLSERVLSAWFSSVADSGLTTIQKAAEDDCFVNVHFGGQPDVHFDKSRFAKVRICSNSASCWLLHSQDIAAVVTDFSYELIRSLIVESRSEWRPVRPGPSEDPA